MTKHIDGNDFVAPITLTHISGPNQIINNKRRKKKKEK